jgi:hypothetical protein
MFGTLGHPGLRHLAIILAAIAVMAAAGNCQRHEHAVVLDWGEFQSIDKVPPKFGNSVTLSLSSLRVPRRGRIVVGRLSGSLEADGVSDITMVSPTIRGRRLSFTTRAKDGVSYRFSGLFPENFSVDEHGNPDAILRGTLTKFKSRIEPARAELVFRFQFYSD